MTVIEASGVSKAFRIPSESMEDTLLVGDFLFANKLLYGPKLPFMSAHLPAIRQPKQGDIIIFRYPNDPKVDYIKRCVAVEGQTVELIDNQLPQRVIVYDKLGQKGLIYAAVYSDRQAERATKACIAKHGRRCKARSELASVVK